MWEGNEIRRLKSKKDRREGEGPGEDKKRDDQQKYVERRKENSRRVGKERHLFCLESDQSLARG